MLCICLFSRPNVSLVVVLVLLISFMLTTAVLCIVSADHHQPLQSNYAVYRHAAVASDAAPCSVVGRFVSNNHEVIYVVC